MPYNGRVVITDFDGPLWNNGYSKPEGKWVRRSLGARIGFAANPAAGRDEHVRAVPDGLDLAELRRALTFCTDTSDIKWKGQKLIPDVVIVSGPWLLGPRAEASYHTVVANYLAAAKAEGVRRIVLQSFCRDPSGHDAFSKALRKNEAMAKTFPEWVIVNFPTIPEIDMWLAGRDTELSIDDGIARAWRMNTEAGTFPLFGKLDVSNAYTLRADAQRALMAAAELESGSRLLNRQFDCIGGIATNSDILNVVRQRSNNDQVNLSEITPAAAKKAGGKIWLAKLQGNTRQKMNNDLELLLRERDESPSSYELASFLPKARSARTRPSLKQRFKGRLEELRGGKNAASGTGTGTDTLSGTGTSFASTNASGNATSNTGVTSASGSASSRGYSSTGA